MVSKQHPINAIVCLPTMNESESIHKMITAITRLCLPIFVSDQQSTDGTQDIARELNIEVFDRKGTGKGSGVRESLVIGKEKGYEFLILIDCDDSYPVETIHDFLEQAPVYDMISGARNFGDITFLRRLVNIIHTQTFNILFAEKIHDINTGLRILRIEKFLNLQAEGFDIEAEIQCTASKKNMSVLEIPIRYKQRKGKSKIGVWDTWVILKRLFIERLI